MSNQDKTLNESLPTVSLSKDDVREEAQRFYSFIAEVILPAEPKGFKHHSGFHQRLIHYACQEMSIQAAPRNHLKSTIFSKYRVLHRLVDPTIPEGSEKDYIDYLILSETAKLAREHLNWVAYHIENNKILIERYGNLKPIESDRLAWNQEEINLANGNKARAIGYQGQIRGEHPTDIVVDDLESIRNIGSQETLASLKDWFYRVLMGAMDPETRLHVIGTIIAKPSLLLEILKREEFNGIKWKALSEDARGNYISLWPERWPVELLLRRRKLLGTHRFNAEYQNEPIGMEDPIIWEEWIRRFRPEEIAERKTNIRYMACDPAFTEERWGDYSAIVVLDEKTSGGLFEKLAWRKKVASPELISTLMRFYYHFKNGCDKLVFGIEEVAAQKFLRQAITEKDPSIQIVPLRPDKDKTRRLVDVSRYFEMGAVSLVTEELIDEVLNFPKGSKDRVDALVYCLKMYETEHPVISDGSSSVIDDLKELGQNELDLYIEKAVLGVPGYSLPPGYLKNKEEAMLISQMMEDVW